MSDPSVVFLSEHLSAHKYFFVCTLTVAAWDTLVLSPRSWKLLRNPEWSTLKLIYLLLRYLMPIEFTVVAVAFFNTKWSNHMCETYHLFEPIMSAILVCMASAAVTLRLYAIYDKNRLVLASMGTLFIFQVIVMAVCCGFYWVVPLDPGQGCIAGPRHNHNWVGIYWLAPTIFFTAAFGLAVSRSVQSLRDKQLGPWKLLLRDGLNLYATIWVVNMINMLFWFIVKPTGENDTIKTIVTSMAAVLTVTMTMRIILNIKGTLYYGGSFLGQASQPSTAPPNPHSHRAMFSRSGDTHGITTSRPSVVNISPQQAANGTTFTLEEMRAKAERGWDGGNGTTQLTYTGSDAALYGDEKRDSLDAAKGNDGVQVTIDREVLGYQTGSHRFVCCTGGHGRR